MGEEDAQSKIEGASKKYWGSEKGKASRRRYDLSDKGRDARQRYLESEKGQMALLRYYLSEKGFTTRQRHNALTKLMTRCAQYLEANPTGTVEDFLNSLSEEKSG